MHKKLSILVVITLLFMIFGCVSDKFSQEVKLNLKSSDYESTFARFKYLMHLRDALVTMIYPEHLRISEKQR